MGGESSCTGLGTSWRWCRYLNISVTPSQSSPPNTGICYLCAGGTCDINYVWSYITFLRFSLDLWLVKVVGAQFAGRCTWQHLHLSRRQYWQHFQRPLEKNVETMWSNICSLPGSHLINSASFCSYITDYIIYFAMQQTQPWRNAWQMTFCKYPQKKRSLLLKCFTSDIIEKSETEIFIIFSDLFTCVWAGLWTF